MAICFFAFKGRPMNVNHKMRTMHERWTVFVFVLGNQSRQSVDTGRSMAYFCDDRAGGAASQRKYSGGGFTATIQNRLQGFFPYKKHGQSYSFPNQMKQVTRLDLFNKLKHSLAVLWTKKANGQFSATFCRGKMWFSGIWKEKRRWPLFGRPSKICFSGGGKAKK